MTSARTYGNVLALVYRFAPVIVEQIFRMKARCLAVGVAPVELILATDATNTHGLQRANELQP